MFYLVQVIQVLSRISAGGRIYADDRLLTWVVDTRLDDVIHSETAGGGLAPQLTIDILGKYLQ